MSTQPIPLHQPCPTPTHLWHWIHHHLGLSLPRTKVCPNHAAPFEYLCAAYFEPATDIVVWAPRGGGKTRLGAAATLLDLLHKPGIAVRILGGSLEQSLRMWEHLLPDIETLAADDIAGKPRARRVTLKNGSSAAVTTQSQRAVRGLRVQKLRCDEVELFDPAIWEAAQLITRSAKTREDDPRAIAGAIEAISTLHCPGGLMERIVDRAQTDGTRLLHWCLLETLEKCPPDRPCEGCRLFDECQGKAKTLCEGFVTIDDAISLKRRVSIETWQAEMLCLRPRMQGAVFPSFEPTLHVRETLPEPHAEPDETWLAIDFGFNAPFVCLWIASDALGRVFVFDEYIQDKMILGDHINKIKARPHGPVHKVACDPAGAARNDQTGKSDIQELREAQFKVHSRGSKIPDGLKLIRAALMSASGETRLFIHPRCKRLIAAMKAYHYDPNDSELPRKDGTHDHPIDALRYYFINRTITKMKHGWY